MQITLTHCYSNLDNCHQFGLEFLETDGYETYIRWIFFHMGVLLGKSDHIYPYSVGKTVKTYAYCGDATRQAKFIANRIKKIGK